MLQQMEISHCNNFDITNQDQFTFHKPVLLEPYTCIKHIQAQTIYCLYISVLRQKTLEYKLGHFQREVEYIMCYIEQKHCVTLEESNCTPKPEQSLLESETFIEENVMGKILHFCSDEPDCSIEMGMYNHQLA